MTQSFSQCSSWGPLLLLLSCGCSDGKSGAPDEQARDAPVGISTGGVTSNGTGSSSVGAGAVEGVGGTDTDGTGGELISQNTGGSSPLSATSVCGTANEDEAVKLACPAGQVITGVNFASYGNPGGECGRYVQGDCHAETSQSKAEELCIGRASCNVSASNANFGDPCNRTTKSLKVNVLCQTGEPTVLPEPYKGLANSPANEIAETGASWCYNWTTSPSENDCADPLFIPMVWGGGNVASAIQSIGNAGYTTVLGFNEPNKLDQANMTVDAAIGLWPALTSDPNIRVGSPAVSDDGRAWLEDFMAQVDSQGLRVDFIAMHWYGWNEGSCTAGNLESAVNWASQWGKPVWITEFGCMGSSNTDEATLVKFLGDSIAMLENHAQVERYAWYPWNTFNHIYLDGQRTALGDVFAAAPANR